MLLSIPFLFGAFVVVLIGCFFVRRQVGLRDVMSHNFNLREVVKQCILLEMHLNDRGQRCRDCQKKHSLAIEALLEEGISLAHDQKDKIAMQLLLHNWLDILRGFNVEDYGHDRCNELANQVRAFRKPIMAGVDITAGGVPPPATPLN